MSKGAAPSFIRDAVDGVRRAFDRGATRSLAWRLRQLDGLASFLKERESDILAALAADVGKPKLEAYSTEVAYVATEIADARRALRRWAKPTKVSTPLVLQPGKSYVQTQPLGVVLIISPWNILYTGNGTVAQIVMAAAAKHLTPVTLELGGKSPTLVDASANLAVAAKRICWGKFSNAGQTCVAPDYVLAHEAVHDRLIEQLVDTVRAFYGPDPRQSDDYGRIVNARHHRRLAALLDSGTVVVGGEVDESDRYIAPTILRDVSPDSAVMAEEIFGPILPVLRVGSMDEAVAFVNRRPKPLALYLFAEDERVQRDVVERTTSGGASVNHTWMHLANHDLPFGGVGASGTGAYHGKAGFDCFSHHRSVLVKSTSLDAPIMYPPYDETKRKLLRFLL
jgi:aldehyde dehydrogenase (NAD+)